LGARGARLAFVTTFRNISGNPHGYWIVSNWRGLERETGIEPATSRLGSPRERCGQREINGLAWVVEGTKRHFYNHVFDHQSSVSRTIGGDGNRIVAKDGLCQFFFARLHSAADYVPKRSNSGLPGEWPQQFFRNVSAAIEGSPLARASSVKTKRLQVGTILRKTASFLGIAMRKAFPRNSLIRLEPRRDLNPCYRRERARIYWIP
jgi:hypothetical protein